MTQREKSKSFFQRFLCCGDETQVVQPLKRVQTDVTNYGVVEYLAEHPEKDKKQYSMYNQQGYFIDQLRKIKSQKSLKDLRISNIEKPNNKYACPICFRYFNVILQSKCCKNYICHICAIEFKSYKCHFCENDHVKYIDVQDTQEIKLYSDSQGFKRLQI